MPPLPPRRSHRSVAPAAAARAAGARPPDAGPVRDLRLGDDELPVSRAGARNRAGAGNRAGASGRAVHPPTSRRTERMAILRALEQGELDVATAMDRLAALDDEPRRASGPPARPPMTDALEQVLRLVADGRLTAAQAAPILDALATRTLDGPADDPTTDRPEADGRPGHAPGARRTSIRIEITEGGRKVVNLRVPVSLGRMALDRIPGLSGSTSTWSGRPCPTAGPEPSSTSTRTASGVRIALE